MAGQSYYIQANHLEGGGGDYVKVGWKMDGDTNAASTFKPISGAYLSGFAPPQFYPTVANNGQVTLKWTGTGTLLQSSDLKTWSPVTGNPPSPFTFTPQAGQPNLYYRVQY